MRSFCGPPAESLKSSLSAQATNQPLLRLVSSSEIPHFPAILSVFVWRSSVNAKTSDVLLSRWHAGSGAALDRPQPAVGAELSVDPQEFVRRRHQTGKTRPLCVHPTCTHLVLLCTFLPFLPLYMRPLFLSPSLFHGEDDLS